MPKSNTKKETVTTTSPDINNYELTFKVAGLSFLFTDMIIDGFIYFDPLFVCDPQGNFYQYYKNEKIEKASKFGIRWLSKPNGFKDYHKHFYKYYNKNYKLLHQIIQSEKLTKSSIRVFFKILSTIFLFDTKLDNKFTDIAYLNSNNNPVLKKNLKLLSNFKNVSRVWINQTFLEENNPLSKFVNKISRQFSIKKSDLENYTILELIQLFDNKKVSAKTIKDRKYSYTIYYSSGKRFYITGKKSASFIKKIQLSESNSHISQVKGLVANKVNNKIIGKVKVINVDYGNMKNMAEQMSAMKKGEILVAEFTAPELMPACKKAKAIITDIGGMLSHAAIISRELKITSIIGTKNASSVFKDGDVVEVDANKGVIKKLI